MSSFEIIESLCFQFSESEEEFKEPALRFTQVEPSEKRRSWFDDIIKKLGKRSENNIN